MTYLVDANILSEPTRAIPSAKVVNWLLEHESELVVDAIILAELGFGILCLPRGQKRVALSRWLRSVTETVLCLPWDAATSAAWASLVVELKRKGRNLPIFDSMIAATALRHDLVVVTHNSRDFQHTGVTLLDPFGD